MSESEFEHYSLFGERWWLDAVAPGQWAEAVVASGGQVQARLRYMLLRQGGLRVLGMPLLTQTLGPWFAPMEGKYAQQLARQKDCVEGLLTALPAHDLFLQRFHPDVTNWLPWHWAGYQQTTRYTYVLPDISDPAKLWPEFRYNIRNDVRKAQKRFGLKPTTERGDEVLFEIYRKTFQRQGEQPQISLELLQRLCRTCRERGSGETLYVADGDGRVHAAALIVWDRRCAYYLLGGGDPELRNSGAHSLLLWEAIQRAAPRARSFDFEGSMVEGIERFFRAFNARQVAYSRVWGARKRWVSAGLHLRNALRALRGQPPYP